MEIAALTDTELLAAWVKHRDEAAFHTLVSRYAGLVHSAAKRACGDDSLAAEASQLTFILLTRKAKSLVPRASLGGWLYLTAAGEAKNLLRSSTRENRKRSALLSAMALHTPDAPDPSWQEIQPFLNDALAALSEKDREAIILRFYRSLSVREIAASLGIATDAAQKRLDRATERLREKLTRRGVTTAGSLSATMLAGFSADAQAAVISTSVLSSKAIAASAIAPATPILATLLAMKATTYIVPAVILLCGGLFLNSQSQAISTLEKNISETRLAIATRNTEPVTTVSKTEAPRFLAKMKSGAIDWNLIAREMSKNPPESRANQKIFQELYPMLRSLSREDLIAAYERIAQLDCQAEIRATLERHIVIRLAEIDPDYAFNRFSEFALKYPIDFSLRNIFEDWLKQDLGKATAWMDSQVAAGNFSRANSSGFNESFSHYEASIASFLFSKDPAASTQRLSAIPQEARIGVLRRVNVGELSADERVQYALLARPLVPKEDQPYVISRGAFPSGIDQSGLPALTDYLQKVSATPPEISEVIRTAENYYSTKPDGDSSIAPTREDYDVIRAWVRQQSPADLDSFTGNKLQDDVQEGRLSFQKAAELVGIYHDEGGSDKIIRSFLLDWSGSRNLSDTRELAGRVRDPKVREEILKTIE